MDRLLADGGCPWDRVQTLATLRPYLIEEAYEVLESLDDPRAHCKELGDLLFQVVFHAALRERQGEFDLEDVIAGIRDKMIRRHPHVFGPKDEQAVAIDSPEAVAQQWAAIKAAERQRSDAPPDPLAGVPRSLPALARAWRLQDKAAAVGFDWPDIEGALGKLREEWAEFEEARRHGDADAIEDEFGDLLFVMVRVGQKLGITAEDALRRANDKFEARFSHVMRRCHETGIDPRDAGLARLDAFWDEAKARGLGRRG